MKSIISTPYLLLPIRFLLFLLGVKSQTTYFINDCPLADDFYTNNVGGDANPGFSTVCNYRLCHFGSG